jgi:hypothetical protein
MAALINLRVPAKPVPHSMLYLANRLQNAEDEFIFGDIVLPQLPPRQPAEIVALLKKGAANKISLLEWINLFQSHEYFSALYRAETIQVFALIWAELGCNEKLRRIALWRICQDFNGQPSMMPGELLKDCLTPLKHIQADKPRQTLMATIAVVENNAEKVADYSLSLAKTPSSLFAYLRLPSRLSILNDAKESLEEVLGSKGIEDYSAHYITIIECYSELDRDQAVQRMLNFFSKETLTNSGQLLRFLKHNYAPSVKETRWQYLDSNAQSSLREIIGSAWFGDFKKFIFQLTSPKLAEALNFNDYDIRQLRSRVTFWSNYQTRFHSFKVFLPLRTAQIIQNTGLTLPENGIVEDFTNSRKETELCILEFEDHIVVEYLRGDSSALQVFSKANQQLTSKLLANKLRIEELKKIHHIKDHDHLYYWQNSCEKMLRQEFNIYPDNNLKYFEIVASDGVTKGVGKRYDGRRGLPPLDAVQLKKREQALKNTSGSSLPGYQAESFSDNNNSLKNRGAFTVQKGTNPTPKKVINNTANKNLLGMYQNCLVTHTSRSELGIGMISKMHADGYIDVEFESAKFSSVSANKFRVV